MWLSILMINLAMMTRRQVSDSVLFEVFCLLVYSGVFYVNTILIFPRTYEKSRKKYWISGLILALVAFVIIEIASEIVWGTHHHRGKDWIEKVLSFKQVLWIIIIFLSGTIFSTQELLARQLINREKLIEEKLQTELQLLKAHINPHFIFNALNNIYSLTYMKSEKAPDSVLKLSEILRYILEDCRNDMVPLEDEILHIKNFIEFQRLRLPGLRKIETSFPQSTGSVFIAPMLFIPFIENCFKYSRLEEDISGFISLNIGMAGDKITFSSSNSVFQNRQLLKGSGTGIENVRKRLSIIYPDRHRLRTILKDKVYYVELEIEL